MTNEELEQIKSDFRVLITGGNKREFFGEECIATEHLSAAAVQACVSEIIALARVHTRPDLIEVAIEELGKDIFGRGVLSIGIGDD